MQNISHKADTTQALLLYPAASAGVASGGVVCSLAATAQKVHRQLIAAARQVDTRLNHIIFINFALGPRVWAIIAIVDAKYPTVEVMSATASVWYLFHTVSIKSRNEREDNKTHIATTIVGGNAPFNIIRAGLLSRSIASHHFLKMLFFFLSLALLAIELTLITGINDPSIVPTVGARARLAASAAVSPILGTYQPACGMLYVIQVNDVVYLVAIGGGENESIGINCCRI